VKWRRYYNKVVVGDVAKSLDRINLGTKTNQNFVNLSEEKFVDKIRKPIKKAILNEERK